MIKKINNFVLSPACWWLLASSALALELTALFFQYGMGLEPCIMCVYQRVAILAIVIGGVIGAIGNRFMLGRLLGFAAWGTGAIWGLKIAIEHVKIQQADSWFYTCDLFPNFPTWAPLHDWFPALFAATGDCGEISWSFLGFSMPQWMIVIFAIYSLLFVTFFIGRLLALVKK
ncbi:disulfide bond formation protein DsbB [Thalassotalea maritima]|uniref:disulfide bond formation protein DsbB n=1 Tax=Thalassotalea maritima TaxID=3242416 RepID=UPI003529606C